MSAGKSYEKIRKKINFFASVSYWSKKLDPEVRVIRSVDPDPHQNGTDPQHCFYHFREELSFRWSTYLSPSFPDPDPHVFEPPGSESGSISQRYGSGSFNQQAKIVRDSLIPSVLWLLLDFFLSLSPMEKIRGYHWTSERKPALEEGGKKKLLFFSLKL